jgi:predicted CXXCH cytochrome family protein
MAEPDKGGPEIARVPLDDFRKPDRLDRWRHGLTLAAGLAGAACLVTAVAAPGFHAPAHSPGPLAAVHGAWEIRCEACHEPYVPLSSAGWTSFLSPSPGPGRVSDEACRACHAGPPHHAAQKAASVGSCAACHREHRGRDASLVRVDDAACTGCHRDLPAHTEGGGGKYDPAVTSFTLGGHQEFRVLRPARPVDPGALEFNHRLHMTPGMVAAEGSKAAWLLACLAEADRERYRQPGQPDGDPVRLTCAACHRLDDAAPGAPPSAPGAGAYMAPVRYDAHCRACHPLDHFDDRLPGLAAPHRVQPGEMADFLARTYAARYLADHPGLLEQPVRPRPRPDHPESPEAKTAREAVAGWTLGAEKNLYEGKKTCGKCHAYEEQPGKVAPRAVRPTAVPQVWLEHARFSHTAHRAVDCRQCHARAYPDTPDASTRGADVLIADGVVQDGRPAARGVGLCLECHGPPRAEQGVPRGGARHDCAECHTYHAGDRRQRGVGVAERDPDPASRRETDISRFLRGR